MLLVGVALVLVWHLDEEPGEVLGVIAYFPGHLKIYIQNIV